MRAIRIAAAVIVLFLAACAQEPAPTTAPEPSPPALPAATATLAPAPSAAAPEPAASATAAPQAAASPLPATAAPSAAPTASGAPADSATWPSLVRSLHFGLPAGNSYEPRALAVYPTLRRVYARTHAAGPGGTGLVTAIDLAGDEARVVAVAETGPDPYSDGGLIIDTVRNRLFAVNAGDATCTVLQADTLKEVQTLSGVSRLAIDEAGGRLYAAGTAGLQVFDAARLSLAGQVVLDGQGQEVLALAVDPTAGRLYLVRRDTAGSSLDVYDAVTLDPVASTLLPGPVDSLVVDSARGRAYLTANDGSQSLLWTVDTDGRRLEVEPVGDWLQKTYLALDPAGGRLFLVRDSYPDHAVVVRDLEGGRQAAEIPLAYAPHGLAWDADSGRLVVSHTYDERLSVVDVAAGQVVQVVPVVVGLVDLAVDPARGQMYVTDSAGRLMVLDSDTDERLATLVADGYISVDSPHGRFYTGGGETNPPVRVWDADRLQPIGDIDMPGALPVADAHSGGLYVVRAGVYVANLETLTVTAAISGTLPQFPGFSPNPAAVGALVDPGSGRLFVIINNGVPGSNNGNYLYVYEPVSYQQVLTDTERSPFHLDVDPATGRLYVSRIYMDRRAISLLEDGRTYTARLDGVVGHLRVDPGLGRLYVTVYSEQEGRLLVLDAATLDVLGSVPVSLDLKLYALDAQRHLLYLASGDGRVEIWSASGGELPSAAPSAPTDLVSAGISRLFPAPGLGSLLALDQEGHLYRSDDAGASWGRLGGGLPEEAVATVAFSPAWPQDPTLFAAVASYGGRGLGVFKSTDGGQSWRMASAGLADLAVNALALSPGFVQDHTLFATDGRGGVFRSTDAGQSWTSLADRFDAESGYDLSRGILALSPGYIADGTLFVTRYGLQRSTDGGQTWRQVGESIGAMALSPNYGQDRTLFVWDGQAGLLRSTDGGGIWQAASVRLEVTDFGSARLLVAPDYATSQTLYLVWTPGAAGSAPRYFRSTDAARTWESLVGDPPQGATPVEFAPGGDALVALDPAGRLVRWPLAGLRWQRAAAPALAETAIDHVVLSPGLARDKGIYAISRASSILRSGDGGLTWTDTDWPVRVTFGDPVKVAPVEPATLLAGTALGLYRSDAGGPWEVVGGGLPAGLSASTPAAGADGSLRLRAGGIYPEQGPRTFISTDGGRTWTEPIPALPVEGGALDLVLSPAVASDRTAFLGTSGRPPLRTVGGGAWQEIGPAGQSRLSWLRISPAFDRDGLVVARYEESELWRSTDRGDTWTRMAGPWAEDVPDVLTFLPDFASAGVLLGEGRAALYRSADRGATWQKALDIESWGSQVIVSPGYAADGTVYLAEASALHRSTDGGQTWTKLPGIPWGENDDVHFVLSPAFAQDTTLLAWTLLGAVFESTDGGQSWQDVSAGLPASREGIRQVIFSPDYARDGLAFLVPYSAGILRRVGAGSWFSVTEAQPPAPPAATRTPTPIPAPVATSTPAPSPAPTAAPPVCALEPVRFKAVWQMPGVAGRLGCAVADEAGLPLAGQAFEHGRMIWDSGTWQIYVLLDTGTWQVFDDTFAEGVDPEYDPALPAPPQQPVRGFGKVWREQLGGAQSAIGWAVAQERSIQGWRQAYERGLLLWTDDTLPGGSPGVAYLLYADGTWTAVAVP